VYTSDEDDGSTSAKELKEKGYTLPEYHFVAEYDGAESEQSKLLEVKGWIDYQIFDERTGELLADRDYILLNPERKLVTGHTDKEGFIKAEGIKIGEYKIIT
jgi:hypothetical protein